MTVLLGTAVAGALGTVLRAEVTARAGPLGSPRRAAAVAVVNVVGAAVLATLVARGVSTTTLVVVGVGFCGALTTFSTWVTEATLAVERGRRATAVAVVDLTAQLVVGVLVVLALTAVA